MSSAEFNLFTDAVADRLKLPLPGASAHSKMASQARLRLKISPSEQTRKSAILILFYPFLDEVFMPLILRPAYDGVHGGQMAFPGGRMERSDENLVRTALREAQEEIGIRLTDVRVLGQLSQIFIPPSNFHVLPVIGAIPYRPDFYPDSREVDEIVEVALSDLANDDIITLQEIEVRGVKIDAPTYNVQGHNVWGATAMMIAELLAVTKDAMDNLP
ncbi:MAG: CoA pyrophosphatase [Spirosomataceae bacterium]